MGYGLKILSGNGSIQVDSDNTNKVIYQLDNTLSFTGTFTVGAAATAAGYGTASVPLIGGASALAEKILFFRPDYSATTPGSSLWIYYTNEGFFAFGYPENSTWEHAAFRRVDQSPNETGYGLEVYASDGSSKRFTSSVQSLRIKGVIKDEGPAVDGTNLWATNSGLIESWKIPFGYIRAWAVNFSSSAVSQAIEEISESRDDGNGDSFLPITLSSESKCIVADLAI